MNEEVKKMFDEWKDIMSETSLFGSIIARAVIKAYEEDDIKDFEEIEEEFNI